MRIILLLYFSITLASLEEYDYCNFTCGTTTTNLKHIVCERKQQCNKPSNECRAHNKTELLKEERELILSNHPSLQKPKTVVTLDKLQTCTTSYEIPSP